MANTDNQMTFERAVELLEGDIFTYTNDELSEAMRIVKDKAPNHPVLKATQEKLNAHQNENNITETDVNVYVNNTAYLDNISTTYGYSSFIQENADIKKYVDVIDIVDNKNKKNLTGKQKQKHLELLFEAAKLKALTSLAGSKEFEQKSPQEKENAIKEEIKNTFFADFARTTISSFIKTPTKKESKIGTKEYKQYILKQVQSAASAFKNFIEGNKRIRINTDNILASCADSAVQIETYINALKQKAKKTEASVRDGFNKVAKFFQDKKNKLEQKANHISENRYEIFKAVKGSFKDNKIKLIGNVSASAVFGAVTAGIAAGTVGAPITLAVGAYATYHAAGAWVYPIIAEMRKINRLRREKGEKPLKFKEQLAQAWKNKTSKDENKNSYKARNTYIVNGVVNTGLAAIGFGCLKDGLEAIDEVKTLTESVADGLNTAQSTGINIDLANSIAETKHAVSMGRIAIPLAGQFADAGVTYAISVADPDNKEKAQEAKQTAVAALVGAGFSALAQGVSFAMASNATDLSENLSQVSAENNAIAETIPSDIPNEPKSSEGVFSKLKNLLGFSAKENTDFQLSQDGEAAGVTALGDTSKLTDNTELTGDTESQTTLSSQGVNEFTTDANTEVLSTEVTSFPDTYNENMGISEKQYNTLVSTTEGTLKSATGEEITLDKAYMALDDDTMANFPNQTKEEVLYKFNRLYAFMRKAYEVGDGTLRETPSGAEYLESRFETMNLNLNDEKMDTLLTFAKENTYASRKDIESGLKEIFPEEINAKTMSALVTTIHSNQRFNQHAEEMEALINLLGCGKELSAEEAFKVNSLLEQTDEILKTGKENNILTGLNLSKDCHDDDGQWQQLPEKVAPPKLPILDDEIEIIDEDIVIEDDVLLDNPRLMVAKMPLQQPVNPIEQNDEIIVTKSVSSNVHGITDPEYADKSKVLDGARGRRLARKASRE